MTEAAEDAASLIQGIRSGDRRCLARAITFAESTRPEHRVIADAVAEGLMARASRAAGGAAAPEPLAEWEREMLAGSAEVAADVEGTAVENSGVIEVVEETTTPSEA